MLPDPRIDEPATVRMPSWRASVWATGPGQIVFMNTNLLEYNYLKEADSTTDFICWSIIAEYCKSFGKRHQKLISIDTDKFTLIKSF